MLRDITYVYLLIFEFINPWNITIQGLYIKVTTLNIYPNFWGNVLSKIQISEKKKKYIYMCINIYIYIYIYIANIYINIYI